MPNAVRVNAGDTPRHSLPPTLGPPRRQSYNGGATSVDTLMWVQMTYFDDGRARLFGRMPGQLFGVRLDVIAWTKARGTERLSDGPP